VESGIYAERCSTPALRLHHTSIQRDRNLVSKKIGKGMMESDKKEKRISQKLTSTSDSPGFLFSSGKFFTTPLPNPRFLHAISPIQSNKAIDPAYFE
jgi:hypothetical protein